jgi:hypothetical protein
MSGGHGDSSPAIDALRTSSMTLIYILGDFGDVQRAHNRLRELTRADPVALAAAIASEEIHRRW